MRYPGFIWVAICLCLCGCDQFKKPETRATEEAWSKLKETLKAPSTATLVNSSVTEIKDRTERLKYYIASNFAISGLNRELDLAKSGVDIAKDTGDLEFIDKESGTSLALEFRHKKGKNETIKILEKAIATEKTKCQTTFNGNDRTIKVYYVDIHYDAQNSYGAMLRGDGICVVVSTRDGGVFQVVEVNGVAN